jgi:hypothetical protein
MQAKATKEIDSELTLHLPFLIRDYTAALAPEKSANIFGDHDAGGFNEDSQFIPHFYLSTTKFELSHS